MRNIETSFLGEMNQNQYQSENPVQTSVHSAVVEEKQPVKETTDMSIADTKAVLRALFDYYSMRSGRISCESLKSGEFHRMMADAGML
jgi:hypothetical protein